MRDAGCVRTTLTLDDDILASARALARQRELPLGTVISELARRGLSSDRTSISVRNGLRLFPVRAGAGTVTPEIVKRLLEESE